VSEINLAQPALSHGSATLPRMGHLLGYARVSTTDQQPSSRSTPWSAPAATGCSPKPPAAPAPTAPPSNISWTNSAPATPWSSGNSTASAAPCATWSTPSPDSLSAGSGSAARQEAIDTTTPGGKLVFHVFAALAEFERDLIRERTAAGRLLLGSVAVAAADRR
jgi:hypothetical protein